MPDEIKEISEMQTPETERQKTPIEQKQRIKELVKKKPIMGGQEGEKEPKIDISALIEAEVKARVAGIEGEVGRLRAELDSAKAQVEVLREQNRLLSEGLKDTFDKVAQETEATRKAVEKSARADEVTSEYYQIPEAEREKTKEGWLNKVRDEVTRLRRLGESPYSPYLWSERPEMKRIFNSIDSKEFPGLREELANEVWVIQREDKLYAQWRHGARKLDALGELVDIAPVADLMLTPEILSRLSALPETEVPPWLQEIIPPKERSLSVQISRGVYHYTKFFGEWTEAMAKKLDEPGGIEEQGREKWRKGEFGRDKKKWNKWVGDQLRDIDWARDKQMQDLNKEVLKKLGFGEEGKISYRLLKSIFKEAPPEFKTNPTFQLMELQVSRAPETGGLTLFDLLRIVPIKEKGQIKKLVHLNMFCQNVVKDQVDYTRWLVGALSGGSYAEESAIRFLNYTGESAEMNTTAAPIPYLSDGFYHLCHPEKRRLSEARKRRAGGPIMTLGRYPDMCQSWMRKAELKVYDEKTKEDKEKSVLECLREGRWFHTLPWGQLSEEGYVGNFLLNVTHAVNAFKTITDRNIELTGREGLLGEGDNLERRNKSFQYAFSEWEDEKDGKTGFERREEWARRALVLVRAGKLSEFSKQKWSPWFTFTIGLIFEHHPERGKLPEEAIQSSTGIKVTKEIPHSRRWAKKPQKVDLEGRIVNLNSVSDFLDEGVNSGFLTPSEAELAKTVCKLEK